MKDGIDWTCSGCSIQAVNRDDEVASLVSHIEPIRESSHLSSVEQSLHDSSILENSLHSDEDQPLNLTCTINDAADDSSIFDQEEHSDDEQPLNLTHTINQRADDSSMVDHDEQSVHSDDEQPINLTHSIHNPADESTNDHDEHSLHSDYEQPLNLTYDIRDSADDSSIIDQPTIYHVLEDRTSALRASTQQFNMAQSPSANTSTSSGNVTVVGKQGDYSPAAIVGGLRAPSPAPSEASTSSSNQSLDLMRCKKCTVENCQEVLVVSGKRRKGPWMCNYHRNKTYKAKKKQKDEKASNIQMIKKKEEESPPKPPNHQTIPSGEQSTSDDGLPRLDQVLNEKKLALLRSPAIIKFLQESQQQLSNTHHQQSSRASSFTPGRTSASSRDEHFLHASPPKLAKGGQM